MLHATQSSVFSLAPFHIISYATLTGSTFFQSFIGGVLTYRALDRPQFGAVQERIFPVYFGIQTVLPIVLALTYPGAGSGTDASGAISSFVVGGPDSGLAGVMNAANRWTTLAPLAVMFTTAVANYALLPIVTDVMHTRRAQEKKDGKKSWEEGPHSEKMKELNARFGMLHGISSLLNLATFGSQLWYGFTLASRIV